MLVWRGAREARVLEYAQVGAQAGIGALMAAVEQWLYYWKRKPESEKSWRLFVISTVTKPAET